MDDETKRSERLDMIAAWVLIGTLAFCVGFVGYLIFVQTC